MENSNIEWTDHTFNPWIGCTKVSPGCANCYAEALMDTRHGRVKWGPGQPRSITAADNWKGPRRWDRLAAAGRFVEVSRGGVVVARGDSHKLAKSKDAAGQWIIQKGDTVVKVRPRVFCASLADWLDYEVPTEWRVRLFALIEETPHLDWLLLTKRPESWSARLHEATAAGSGFACRWLNGEAPANVWAGTTVEDQRRADERIPELLRIPAVVRFLSCEPLLGPVQFSNVTRRSDCVAQLGQAALAGIHWVIVGGESGHGARPMHPAWARSIRDQCAAVGVPMLFKQWGEWAPYPEPSTMPAGSLHRPGKKLAGRLLDGREWNGLPSVAAGKGVAS